MAIAVERLIPQGLAQRLKAGLRRQQDQQESPNLHQLEIYNRSIKTIGEVTDVLGWTTQVKYGNDSIPDPLNEVGVVDERILLDKSGRHAFDYIVVCNPKNINSVRVSTENGRNFDSQIRINRKNLPLFVTPTKFGVNFKNSNKNRPVLIQKNFFDNVEPLTTQTFEDSKVIIFTDGLYITPQDDRENYLRSQVLILPRQLEWN